MSQLHHGQNRQGKLNTSNDLLICCACGTQFEEIVQSCRICDDPRQYVPPSGQAFSTLSELRSAGHRLVFEDDPIDPNVISITVQPNVGIGQRAILIKTPNGNILWDLVCYLDEDAVSHINSVGGISAIVISHPHFYTSWVDWSATFDVPVYLAAADEEWLSRRHSNLQLLTKMHNEIVPGVTAIVAGGHFPGSMVLHTNIPNTIVPSIFHADTIHTVPNARSPDIATAKKYANGHTSYSFMWSIPNNIPLSADEILGIWRALKGFDIHATYGFVTVRSTDTDIASIPERILESAKVVVKRMGFKEHELLRETL